MEFISSSPEDSDPVLFNSGQAWVKGGCEGEDNWRATTVGRTAKQLGNAETEQVVRNFQAFINCPLGEKNWKKEKNRWNIDKDIWISFSLYAGSAI